jgi:hypothetical protein
MLLLIERLITQIDDDEIAVTELGFEFTGFDKVVVGHD